MEVTEHLRLTEILTTSAAVADYLGEPVVVPAHLLRAIEILRGEISIDALGRPVSRFVPRPEGSGGAHTRVREIAQLWFARLGGDFTAVLDETQLAEFVIDLRDAAGEVTP